MTAPVGIPWIQLVIPIITFLLGFAASRFTLSKKERKDVEQANYLNAKVLVEAHDKAFQAYAAALGAYEAAPETSFSLFLDIATTGEAYFYQARLTSDSILSDKVDRRVRDSTLAPKICAIARETLPQHYEVMREIAGKKGYDYMGELRRENYESIFEVVERYGRLPAWKKEEG
jgi:hypothetical protein